MRDKGFRAWLYDYRGRKILPAVAYVELAVYFRSRHKTIGEVHGILNNLDVEIEPFQGQAAEAMVEILLAHGIMPGTGDYYKMWRDHSIAGHAHTAPLTVVTYNVADFAFLHPRVITPVDAMRYL